MDASSSIARTDESSQAATDAEKQARVAKLQICRDSACSFPTNPHLLVDVVDVLLHRDNATAISYAWGEFDRQKRTVGHTVQPTKHVELELGTEWIVSDVVDRLAELSEEKPIWMDQLCIPQQEDIIVKTLADIPSIFRTLDVVVLFPGSLCGCIPKFVNTLSQIPSSDHGYEDRAQAPDGIERQDQCLSLPALSWNQRMWTHQEFMHSKRCRCVWASKIENPCVMLHDPDINVENLPPFQKRMFEMLTKSTFSQEQALETVYYYIERVQQTMCADLVLYFIVPETPYHGHDTERFYRFLLGEQFEKPQDSPFLDIKEGRTIFFLGRLSTDASGMRTIGRARREATKPRDYIVSVWTACPDYVVPGEYKSMSAAKLMQDALDQLQRNHAFTVVVTAPQGLFDAESSGSALWNPLEYLSEIDPSCDVDLYRVLANEGTLANVFPRLPKSVPVVHHDTAQPSLSSIAMDYKMLGDHFHKASGNLADSTIAQTVIKLIHRTMSHWSDNRVNAVHLALDRLVPEWHTRLTEKKNWWKSSATVGWFRRIYPIKDCMRFLCSHRKTKAFDEAYYQELDSLINLRKLEDIHKVVYNVVAAALELDLEYCEKKNVKLIFSSINNDERRRPRVGFCRGDVDIENIASEEKKTITVSLGGPRSTLLYEAIHIKDLEGEGFLIPAYRVFAVWVPTESIADDEYGANTLMGRPDADERSFGLLL